MSNPRGQDGRRNRILRSNARSQTQDNQRQQQPDKKDPKEIARVVGLKGETFLACPDIEDLRFTDEFKWSLGEVTPYGFDDEDFEWELYQKGPRDIIIDEEVRQAQLALQAQQPQQAMNQQPGGQLARDRPANHYQANPWPRVRQHDGVTFVVGPGVINPDHEGMNKTITRSMVHFVIARAVKKHELAILKIEGSARCKMIHSDTDEHLINVYKFLFGPIFPKNKEPDAYFNVVNFDADVDFEYSDPEIPSRAVQERIEAGQDWNDELYADPNREVIQRRYKRPYRVRVADDDDLVRSYLKLQENKMRFKIEGDGGKIYVATAYFEEFVREGDLAFYLTVAYSDPDQPDLDLSANQLSTKRTGFRRTFGNLYREWRDLPDRRGHRGGNDARDEGFNET